LSVVAIIMIFLLLLLSRRPEDKTRSGERWNSRATYQLIVLTVMSCCPVAVAVARGANVPGILAWDLYFLVLVGFGEEIKYRGYFQSRINAEYGRPWKIAGISFGPGLIVVSLLFGLSHVAQFGVFNPFLGEYTVNPWMFLQAFWGGLFFGLIREKSGGIVASSLAHGVPNAFGQVLFMALK
jgi:membrane protease YdiL (CAAX protease family)